MPAITPTATTNTGAAPPDATVKASIKVVVGHRRPGRRLSTLPAYDLADCRHNGQG